jgi:hypothetical protein
MRVEELWTEVRDVLDGNYEHIFRAFIKDEPHKKAKADEGRWRLIIACALPVQMVWRMAFRLQNARLNEACHEIPSKHGMVFCYGGWRRFLAEVDTKGLKVSRDISGWDINSPGWVFDADLELRTRLVTDVNADWIRVTEWLYKDAFHTSKILFSNGLVYEQCFSGFMKSGIFSTISTNGDAMYLMHGAACVVAFEPITPFCATGDDVVQSSCSKNYKEALERLGCVVKEVIDGIEFMGSSFEGPGRAPVPLYFGKHVVSFAMKSEVVAEVLDAYARFYIHSPLEHHFWRSVAQEFNVPLRSTAHYREWYDSPVARFAMKA